MLCEFHLNLKKKENPYTHVKLKLYHRSKVQPTAYSTYLGERESVYQQTVRFGDVAGMEVV